MHSFHLKLLKTGLPIAFALLFTGCSGVVGHQYIKTNNNGEITELKKYYSQHGNEYQVTAEFTGPVTLSDDAITISKMADGSFINIQNTQTGSVLKIIEQNGETIYSLFHNKKNVRPSTQQIESYMLGVFSNTPLLAAQHVNTLVKKFDVAAAVNEVEKAQNDDTKSAYIAAICQHQLNPKAQKRVLKVLASVSSDYQQRSAALKFVQQQSPLRDSIWISFFEGLKGMDSDYELRSLLTAVVNQLPDSPTVHTAFFDTTKTIGSDYEKYRLFSEIVTLQSSLKTSELLNASSDIGSDYEAYRLISDISEHINTQDDINALLDFIQSIGSDYEMKRTLQVLPYNTMTKAQTAACIQIASNQIDSDYELAQVLIHIYQATPFKAGLTNQVKIAMNTMSSENEKIKVYEVL